MRKGIEENRKERKKMLPASAPAGSTSSLGDEVHQPATSLFTVRVDGS